MYIHANLYSAKKRENESDIRLHVYANHRHTHHTTHTRTHTHTFSGPLSGTTRVSRYEKGKTNLDFTAARDSE